MIAYHNRQDSSSFRLCQKMDFYVSIFHGQTNVLPFQGLHKNPHRYKLEIEQPLPTKVKIQGRESRLVTVHHIKTTTTDNSAL